MKKMEFTVKDQTGIHARPAALLVKATAGYESSITIEKDGKAANVRKLMEVMALGVKCGETVTFTVDGADEDAVIEGLEQFCKENL